MPTYTESPTALTLVVVDGSDATWEKNDLTTVADASDFNVLDGAYGIAEPWTVGGGFYTAKKSRLIQLTGFGFAVPGGELITAIDLDIDRLNYGFGLAIPNGNIRDFTVQLIVGGVLSGSDLADTGANWPQVLTRKTYNFGGGLTPAEVNAANFGIGIRVTGNGTFSSFLPPTDSQPFAAIDFVQLVITTSSIVVPPPPGTDRSLGLEAMGRITDHAIRTL
jgi:hypothetical protein